MDDRQAKIREGAGLENSRVNQEFLDFLNKWSSPVLMTLAVAALIWAGLQWYQRKQVERVDQAFSELEAATAGGNPSPASLRTIATEYAGVRSVAELAMLETSNIYLKAFVMGVAPGAQPEAQTGSFAETDLLDEDQRRQYLDQAGELASQVLESTKRQPGKALLMMQAQSRMAVVAEGRREFDAARSMYEQLRATAREHQYPSVATLAETRIAELDELKAITPLPPADQLESLPGEQTPGLSDQQVQDLLDSVPQIESEQGPGAEGENAAGIEQPPAGDPALPEQPAPADGDSPSP